MWLNCRSFKIKYRMMKQVSKMLQIVKLINYERTEVVMNSITCGALNVVEVLKRIVVRILINIHYAGLILPATRICYA